MQVEAGFTSTSQTARNSVHNLIGPATKWFLLFNPFISLKLLLLVVCVLTIGLLLAVSVLRVKIDDVLGLPVEG
jgi:hypothetical protein